MKIFWLLTLLISIVFSACRKGCNDPKGNTGIIVSSLSDRDLYCWELKEQKFLVTTDSAYQAVLQIDSSKTYCEDVKRQNIDFTQYSLLGFYAVGGNTDFLRNVIRNDAEKKIIYELTDNRCGNTDEAVISANLVLIPKVPNDYRAEFIEK